ncbi:MAG: ATP-binding protein [Deltaproteobacteria bacterium]|nr:ATP-binding protein [Deltaproteobacteria bacterium]
MALYTTGNLLGSAFLGGVVGNLTASFLWEGGRWVCKPVLDKIPDIAALFVQGGSENNHDLLRALRRAECRVVVSLCDQALLDDFGLRTGRGPLLERMQSRLRERKDPEIRALCRIRRVFAQTYDDLQSMSVDDLVRMYGAEVSEVPTLVKAGSECFAAADPDQLRETVVGQQVAALDRAVRGIPGRARLSAVDLRPLAPDGLPPSLKRHMEQHPQGWWDLLRLAFREELKDPANERARIAWELDVQSALPQQLGSTYREFEEKFSALDEKLTGVWDDLKGFRQNFDVALTGVTEFLEDIRETTHVIDTKVDKLHDRFDRVEELVKQRALRPPFQLPDRALAGRLFGRVALLAELVARLKRREHVDIWGPAGMGKTALAAEAIRAVVGDNPDHLSATPYPDGVVLLHLYRLKFTSLEPVWHLLADAFDASLPTTQAARERAVTACRGRQALVVVEGAEEAGDGSTLQQLLEVLAPETTRVILTRDKRQVSTPKPLNVEAALARDEALALLYELCADATDEATRARLHSLLGGHPLALTWAGRQLGAGEESPHVFLNALQSAQLPDLHQPGYEDHTLRWLFDRSVSRLPPEGRRVLAAAGLLRLSSGEEEQWEFTHALAHQFAGTTSDIMLLGKLGTWALADFSSATENVRRTGDFSRLGRALNHASALLRADRESDSLDALQFKLLYDGSAQIWALGRLDFARDANVVVHAWLARALARRPDDLALQRERSVSYNKFGDVERAAGKLEAARDAYRQGLEIAERLAQQDPTNTQWQRDLSVSYMKLGHVSAQQSQHAEALRYFERARTISARLARHDPSNVVLKNDLVWVQNRIAELQ